MGESHGRMGGGRGRLRLEADAAEILNVWHVYMYIRKNGNHKLNSFLPSSSPSS